MPESLHPVLITAMGDAFAQGESGAGYFVDMVEAAIRCVADDDAKTENNLNHRCQVTLAVHRRVDSGLNRMTIPSRLQFSLRTILAVMSLVAIWFAYLVRQDAARRQLINDIQQAGGTVKFDDSNSTSLFRSRSVSEVAIPNDRIADVGPWRLRSFPNLSTLKLGIEISGNNGATMTPAELQYTEISDELLEQLDSQPANEKR